MSYFSYMKPMMVVDISMGPTNGLDVQLVDLIYDLLIHNSERDIGYNDGLSIKEILYEMSADGNLDEEDLKVFEAFFAKYRIPYECVLFVYDNA